MLLFFVSVKDSGIKSPFCVCRRQVCYEQIRIWLQWLAGNKEEKHWIDSVSGSSGSTSAPKLHSSGELRSDFLHPSLMTATWMDRGDAVSSKDNSTNEHLYTHAHTFPAKGAQTHTRAQELRLSHSALQPIS